MNPSIQTLLRTVLTSPAVLDALRPLIDVEVNRLLDAEAVALTGNPQTALFGALLSNASLRGLLMQFIHTELAASLSALTQGIASGGRDAS